MDTNGNGYNYAYSVLIARRIEAERLRCWRNAALAVYLLPDLFASGSYVEGWIVVPRNRIIEIVEHGWSTVSDREIIDPSIVLVEKQSQQISYFPGYVLSRDQLCELLPGSTLPLVRHTQYGDDGMKHEGYRQAHSKAWQYAQDVAKERQFPLTAIKVSGRSPWRGVTAVIE